MENLILPLLFIVFFPLDKFKNTNNKFDSPFYLDSPKKIFFLTLITGGGYSTLWEYRHWRYLKEKAVKSIKVGNQEQKLQDSDANLIPLLRITVNVISMFLLPRRIKRSNGHFFKNLNPIIFFISYCSLLITPTLLFQSQSDNVYFEIFKILLGILIPILFSLQIIYLQRQVNNSYFKNQESLKIFKTKFSTFDLIYLFLGIIYSISFLLLIFADILKLMELIFYGS